MISFFGLIFLILSRWDILLALNLGFLLIVYLTGNMRTLQIIIETFPRDMRLARRFITIKGALTISKIRNQTVGKKFDKTVKKHPFKICFHHGDEEWSFKRVQETANQYGNYFASEGLKKGDVVSLVMENRPEYVCIWLGLSKLGVVTAFINYNLRFQPLQHCINAANSKAIVYGGELSEAIEDLYEMEGNTVSKLPFYRFGPRVSEKKTPPNGFKDKDIGKEVESASKNNPIPVSPVNFSDKLCYIYTSGTTGLPKASIIRHSRAMMVADGPYYMNGITSEDIILTPLPLYHIQGGICGVGQALFQGTTVVILKKFSASRFWKDCIKYNVTVSQYLGELCRYLLNQPPSPEDKQHKVRLMYGNGVRPEIWEEFLRRFNNPTLCELYGATEGNASLVNFEGKVGAIGVVPRIASLFLKSTIIKVDPVTGNPIRKENGLAIRCKPNEPGEAVSLIVEGDPIRQFDGYTDPKATEKKIIRDIFKKGDCAFRSGDILVMDEYGYFYFKDRTGDTFRWKGENVSTTEVEFTLSKYSDHKDVVVYGVQIPGTDGRAGMASIADPMNSLNLETLASGIAKELPAYARPIFIRVIPQITQTGTYKLQKMDLLKDEYNIHKIQDKIYFYQGGKYVPLTTELYEKINSGKMRI